MDFKRPIRQDKGKLCRNKMLQDGSEIVCTGAFSLALPSLIEKFVHAIRDCSRNVRRQSKRLAIEEVIYPISPISLNIIKVDRLCLYLPIIEKLEVMPDKAHASPARPAALTGKGSRYPMTLKNLLKIAASKALYLAFFLRFKIIRIQGHGLILRHAGHLDHDGKLTLRRNIIARAERLEPIKRVVFTPHMQPPQALKETVLPKTEQQARRRHPPSPCMHRYRYQAA